MIRKLRLRLTLLVIGVLMLVTAGIVLSIRGINLRNIDSTAKAALQVLSENKGRRPDMQSSPPDPGSPPDETPPPKPDEDGETPPPKPDADGDDPPPKPDGVRDSGIPGKPEAGPRGLDMPGGNALASLSNAYTIRLDAAGTITEWSSDRADLYTDAQIQAIADAVIAEGKESGRVDTQYYIVTNDEASGERLLIVLDARLEFMSAYRMLRTTMLVAALACAVLSLGAYLLIRRMLRPVQESIDRQKQFVWDASHEFKTPLAVISANAEVLSRELGPNEYLGYIQSEVRRTDNLVQGLLTLARMDKGTVTAEMKRFDLSEALLEVVLPFESTVFEEGRTLETEIPDGVWIKGDKAMLQQLIVILLSNALKYSDEGGLIRLTLAQKGHGAVITAYNTGPGIAPENLERIFDRFYREDLSHSNAIVGNGLGLSIARTIAEAHGGRIHAESEHGKSATFVVALPG